MRHNFYAIRHLKPIRTYGHIRNRYDYSPEFGVKFSVDVLEVSNQWN